MLKISSLNLNGIRAAHRRGFKDWIAQSNPDIICLQELRAMEHQVPGPIQSLNYHAFYHTAEKKGYSGVGILSREEPISVQDGIGVDWIDQEGRVIMAEYTDLTVFSIYAPSGTTGDARQELKMEFLDVFLPFAHQHLEGDKPVVFCGDFNICHRPIDIHNPKRNKNTSGFLPEERKWVSLLLDTGFEDVYRRLHEGEPDLYSWWSYRAASKERNKGWRIDYHMTSPELLDAAEEAVIEKDWDLSDHAPVTISYNLG
ncbi:exodeoxyribonuclease III [Fodinibius sediminis]|uniref:Exodeoxyribonuclease-3 n=1 Tax=Fodinibius sediminis TaxID=1214077 RepID=A0A521BEH4_9BACT|nr:exodeoxyribonuclease III [Fodinibius sediminis]SMO45518.1 exodeoxyribonuclease-3 [Fodinibius sediminis]